MIRKFFNKAARNFQLVLMPFVTSSYLQFNLKESGRPLELVKGAHALKICWHQDSSPQICCNVDAIARCRIFEEGRSGWLLNSKLRWRIEPKQLDAIG